MPGSGAIERTGQVLSAMPAEDRRALPTTPDDANRLRVGAATELVSRGMIDPNGNGSPRLEARVGNNGQNLFFSGDPNSPVAPTAQVNIANVQAQSNAAVQANFNAAVTTAQQPAPVAPALQPVTPGIEEPGATQRL